MDGGTFFAFVFLYLSDHCIGDHAVEKNIGQIVGDHDPHLGGGGGRTIVDVRDDAGDEIDGKHDAADGKDSVFGGGVELTILAKEHKADNDYQCVLNQFKEDGTYGSQCRQANVDG